MECHRHFGNQIYPQNSSWLSTKSSGSSFLKSSHKNTTGLSLADSLEVKYRQSRHSSHCRHHCQQRHSDASKKISIIGALLNDRPVKHVEDPAVTGLALRVFVSENGSAAKTPTTIFEASLVNGEKYLSW